MNEKSHAQRFDEVFRIILIILAMFFTLGLDISSFEKKVLLTVLFSATLLFWISGHLHGGKYEYTLKIYGLDLSIILTLGLLVTSISTIYTKDFMGISWVLWFLIFINPFISLLCFSILVVYLKDSIDNIKQNIASLLAFYVGYVIATYIGLINS